MEKNNLKTLKDIEAKFDELISPEDLRQEGINHINKFRNENIELKKEFNFTNHYDFLPRIQQNVTKIRFIKYLLNITDKDLNKLAGDKLYLYV